MMRASLFGLIPLVVLGAATMSCRRSTEKEASIPAPMSSSAVAVVAGQEISEERLLAELRRRFASASTGEVTAEQKFDALERLVRQEAVYAKAKASGFEQTPEIQTRIKNLVVAQFREQRFTNATPVVTQREVQLAYEAGGNRFMQPPAWRGAAIFISQPANATAEKRSEARHRAETILNEARRGDDRAFSRLAAKHSEDQSSRYRGGDLGWISRDDNSVDPALVEALERVGEPGGFAPLVETPRGYVVVKLVERRNVARKPLAEVAELLRHELFREKSAQAERDFLTAMKAGLDIRIDRARIEQLSLPSPKNEPPRLPGVTMTQNPSASN